MMVKYNQSFRVVIVAPIVGDDDQAKIPINYACDLCHLSVLICCVACWRVCYTFLELYRPDIH